MQERFSSLSLLTGYCPVEQCSIEYRPETGASIEPHIDDCWVWGERIVQLNLLSSTFLTCIPYRGTSQKYNLADVETYPRLVDTNDSLVCDPILEPVEGPSYKFTQKFTDENCAVKIPLPSRSLLVMFGGARYEWEHGILRSDITQRRVVIAYRELTPPFLRGGRHEKLGQEILNNAKVFY